MTRIPARQEDICEISREARLALALSRRVMSAAHVQHARELIAQEIDWARVYQLAVRNNVIPLLLGNLSKLFPETPPGVLSLFARENQRIRLRAMLLYTQLRMLLKDVLWPRSIPFVIVKGIGLSRRHYEDPFARHCQDVDLLIHPDRVCEVAEQLVGQGWTVGNASWNGQPLRTFVRFASVVEMVSPEGMRFELHRMLDNSGLVFDSKQLLNDAEQLELFGTRVPVLSVRDEFAYVCFHHSRHAWSCLHWCADLPAMMSAPDFNERVLQAALRMPLMGSTVAACVQLASNLDEIASGKEIAGLVRRSPLLAACLRGVDQTVKVAEPVAVGELEPDFPFSWQRSLAYRLRFALSRARPNLNDFDSMPLGEGFQWIYWLTRPWRAVLRRLDVG